MTDRRLEAPGNHAHAVPRDLPDQQVHDGPDPLDVGGLDVGGPDWGGPDWGGPDWGGGAGRYGAPDGRDDGAHPTPDEPSG
ncbi:hypothetical protein ACFV1F_28385 [Streptomyces sp. NPDC059590]|uniref:hypothetical protein n=1 Tax=Streptomyces sp. NPDC059590 TaxID=3346877 RepID=UPI0036B12800